VKPLYSNKWLFALLIILTAAASGPGEEFSASGFSTDWSRIVIDPSEILSGGPPKDGIPALNNPDFVPASEAVWLGEKEPLILIRTAGEDKAYPLQILAWHEIVNDTVGGIPVAVTWCPLCNTTVVFKRETGGRILDFGTTGRLRFSNLLMYDRQTESWWQQADGRAVIGEYAGTELDLYPAVVVSWKEVRDLPGVKVLSRRTGFSRPYGKNPYGGYDSPANVPFLLDRISRNTLAGEENQLMDRVLLIPSEEGDIVLSYSELERDRVIQPEGTDLVVFWTPGTASALDAQQIADGRDVGTANVYSARLNGELLRFRTVRGKILDEKTGSEWNALGTAVKGQLKGSRLTPFPSIQHFWFSAALFRN